MSRTEDPPAVGAENQGAPRPLIVNVGPSDGTMESIERFFSNLDLGSDQVVVLVPRHREALDENRLREVLQRNGRKLSRARDGMPVDGGTVYLCASNMVTAIEGNRFAVREAQQARRERAVGGSFLISSAKDGARGRLEAAREEQSVNEEFDSRSGELEHRVDELTRTAHGLKNFVEAMRIATVFLDAELRVMNFTTAVSEVLYLVETDVGRPIAQVRGHIPVDELYDDIRRVLRTLASVERELTAPDSNKRYIARILPYGGPDNPGVVITFVDVTAIARAEERHRLLLAELQHRVRNALSVIRSIARRSAETSSTVEEYAMHLDGRLNAFVRAQALIIRNPEAGVDLEYLLLEELHSYNAREGEQVSMSGPSIRLRPKAADTFALAFHELATNALKYGALSKPDGRVEVGWRIDDSLEPARLVFDWRERNGPPVTPPQRRGFGNELLERTLAFELGATTTLAFDLTGLHCTIAVPMNSRLIQTSMPNT